MTLSIISSGLVRIQIGSDDTKKVPHLLRKVRNYSNYFETNAHDGIIAIDLPSDVNYNIFTIQLQQILSNFGWSRNELAGLHMAIDNREICFRKV